MEDPNEFGSFDSFTCSIEYDLARSRKVIPRDPNVIVKSFKGSQSLRNADRGNNRRKWDLIATKDEIIDMSYTDVWKAVKEYRPKNKQWMQY